MNSILLTQHHQHIFNAYDKFPFTSSLIPWKCIRILQTKTLCIIFHRICYSSTCTVPVLVKWDTSRTRVHTKVNSYGYPHIYHNTIAGRQAWPTHANKSMLEFLSVHNLCVSNCPGYSSALPFVKHFTDNVIHY